MNLHYLTRRLFGKATMTLGSGTSLGPQARILNALGRSECIRAGRHCRIEGELFLFGHGGEIQIGDWCFIGQGTRIWSARRIDIGDRVLISHNCNVMDSLTHPIEAGKRHEQFKQIVKSGHPATIDLDERPVTIEDDAWIGAGATVLRGVRIGRGSVIGAASVVTQDVPPFSVVVGNPARVVRQLPVERGVP